MDWYRGASPWNQGNIRRGRAKGTWAIEVHRKGLYRVELRRYPREANLPAQASHAALSIAGEEARLELAEDAKSAVFEVKLPAGEHDFTGGFKDAKGKDIGSFFAYVRPR